ncbi:hypothetical protein IU474_09955 [Nocardia otitidiscaviarum]|uniref:hypothetical protein n=1 Tax=Nocardia otitidiscaviarum TaxID=1823 RepID=UPI0018961B7C|nr:hypothetical protein [Nocardia otitidiscaviarum]MBF6237391.1 hypothetical protein [Nocardia otitidiscaviarum]
MGFGNDPTEVAEAFEVALAHHGATCERVVYAVWDRTPDLANRAAFTARFAAADAEPSSNVSPGQGDR